MADYKVTKSDAEWREELGEEAFEVTRKKGTERPFSGKYYALKDNGEYLCVCCDQKLFSSETKYESGTGWPSFYQPVDEKSVSSEQDNSHGMRRTEVMCSNCGAHLGHVFNDGPAPTNLRYCINSVALKFKEK